MYHAIILNNSLEHPDKLLEDYTPFAARFFENSDWVVNGIEVKDSEAKPFIEKIQMDMKEGPYFNHMYGDDDILIIIFKNKTFMITDPEMITDAWEYGKELGIPEDQLGFEPSSYAEEEEYFNPTPVE